MEQRKNHMTQESDLEMEPEDQGSSSISHRLEDLYMQVEALKMVNLKSSMEPGAGFGSDLEKDSIKPSQLVLRAIELQLRILAERSKQGAGSKEELDVILKAMKKVPHLGPLLRRNIILDQLKGELEKEQERD